MSARIDVNSGAIIIDLEQRLYALKRHFTNAYGMDVSMEIDATEVRARAIAVRLAVQGEIGHLTAEGILEHLVPVCEAQTEGFWVTALGRAIALQSGASGEVGDKVNRRMILQKVTGISRQGTYKIQEGLRTDGGGNIKADELRNYLQKREASNA
jgi:hypothetical protein